jgi:hypothetical protein
MKITNIFYSFAMNVKSWTWDYMYMAQEIIIYAVRTTYTRVRFTHPKLDKITTVGDITYQRDQLTRLHKGKDFVE